MLDHIAITVSSVSKSIEWYCSKFNNVKVIYQDETWGMIDVNSLKIAMVLESMHPPHIAFRQEGDVPEKAKSHRDGSRYIYEKDPDGNVIELIWW